MINNAKTIVQTADIPSIPHILQQILSLVDNPRTSSADLEKLVTQEPALMAQLLKWVNSAAYSLPQRVSSIAHAMILLGFSTVKSIASGMVLINAFDDITGLSKEFVNRIWKHTLSTAAIIKILAKNESQKKKDDFFLAGMIHDVGYMVLKQYFGAKYDPLLKRCDFPPVAMESKLFNVDHAQIGAELLTEWKFPETVIDMVRYHHNIGEYERDKKDLYFLKISDALAYHRSLEEFFKRDEDKVDPAFISELALIDWKWKALQDVSQECLEALEMIEGLFVK